MIWSQFFLCNMWSGGYKNKIKFINFFNSTIVQFHSNTLGHSLTLTPCFISFVSSHWLRHVIVFTLPASTKSSVISCQNFTLGLAKYSNSIYYSLNLSGYIKASNEGFQRVKKIVYVEEYQLVHISRPFPLCFFNL